MGRFFFISFILILFLFLVPELIVVARHGGKPDHDDIVDNKEVGESPQISAQPNTKPADAASSGGFGSAKGPNYEYSWGWGSGPGTGWGYGSGSACAPGGGFARGSGFGFGSGTGSGSGSGSGYSYGPGGVVRAGGSGAGSGGSTGGSESVESIIPQGEKKPLPLGCHQGNHHV